MNLGEILQSRSRQSSLWRMHCPPTHRDMLIRSLTMSMSISSSTSAASAMMFSRIGRRAPAPDASQMADDLFSKLDTQNKGYLESSDLASALGSNSSSTSSASAEEVFKSLDSDSDGKLTKTELSDGLKSARSAGEQLPGHAHQGQGRYAAPAAAARWKW